MTADSIDRRQAIEEFVTAMIATACHVDRALLNSETSMRDVDLDSLNLISIATQVAMMYEVEVTADDTLDLVQAPCLGDLIKVIEAIASRNP